LAGLADARQYTEHIDDVAAAFRNHRHFGIRQRRGVRIGGRFHLNGLRLNFHRLIHRSDCDLNLPKESSWLAISESPAR
jgi:hypothetical protein